MNHTLFFLLFLLTGCVANEGHEEDRVPVISVVPDDRPRPVQIDWGHVNVSAGQSLVQEALQVAYGSAFNTSITEIKATEQAMVEQVLQQAWEEAGGSPGIHSFPVVYQTRSFLVGIDFI